MIIRNWVSNEPLVYIFYNKYVIRNSRVIARVNRIKGKNVKLFASGFQRSGNTFLKYLLENTLSQDYFESHLHKVAPIKLAIKRKKKVFILIRSPKECVASSIMKKLEEKKEGRVDSNVAWNRINNDIRLAARRIINDYINYYQQVNNLSNIVIIDFNNLIDFPLSVLNEVHESLNIPLDKTKVSKLVENYSLKKKNQYANSPLKSGLPNDEKLIVKKKLYHFIENDELFLHANRIYENLLKK